jgi:hypothetical protein
MAKLMHRFVALVFSYELITCIGNCDNSFVAIAVSLQEEVEEF